MFTLKVLSIINFLFLLGCSQPNGDAIDNNAVAYSANTVTNDSLLLNIQDKIQGAFQQSVVSGSDASLTALENQLKNTKDQPITDYWLAYLGYHHSIFHLV